MSLLVYRTNPSFLVLHPPFWPYTIDPCKKKGDGRQAQGEKLWGAWLAPRNSPCKGLLRYVALLARAEQGLEPLGRH